MRFLILIAPVLSCLHAAAPAMAGGDDGTGPFEPFDAEPIIADCWQRSETLRGSGYIANYGDGLDITRACMRSAVLEQINDWLLPDFSQYAAAHLDALEELHGDLYYRIDANNRYCTRSCGLPPSMTYIESYIDFLAQVLRDIAEEKSYRYNLLHRPLPSNRVPATTEP